MRTSISARAISIRRPIGRFPSTNRQTAVSSGRAALARCSCRSRSAPRPRLCSARRATVRRHPPGSCGSRRWAVSTGSLPPLLISSSEPRPVALSVDNVPVPIRSPGWRLQPLEAWWVTICAADQYIAAAASPRLSTSGLSPASRILAVRMRYFELDPKPAAFLGRLRRRDRAAAAGRPPGAAASACGTGLALRATRPRARCWSGNSWRGTGPSG